ncbi:type II secretion system protein GspG [bacterium]|nr:type II secretion system protein GspG [bacterium]
MIRSSSAQSGFSLLEIMIAVAILGLILAVASPMLMNQYKKAQKKTTQTSLKMIAGSIDMFQLDVGRIPERLNDLVRRPVAGDYYDQEMVSDWQDGGYLKGGKVSRDSWKQKIQYRLTPEGQKKYELYSYGPNGKGASKSEWVRP